MAPGRQVTSRFYLVPAQSPSAAMVQMMAQLSMSHDSSSLDAAIPREDLYKGAIMRHHVLQSSNASSRNDENLQHKYQVPHDEHRESYQDPTCSRSSARFDGTYHTNSRTEAHAVVSLETNLYNMSFTSDTASSSNEDEGTARRVSEPLNVDMPTEAKSITTVAYQMALKNRPIEQLLSDGERFDTNAYTPTFLHDILMLPGSLANLLDKIPTWNITHQMTPALLPGYKARIHSPSLQPALLQSNNPTDYVQGMLIFGLPKPLRRLIHAHYRPYAKRRKLTLEVELQVLVEEDGPGHVWPIKVFRPRRRAVQAHVWVWSRKRGGEEFFGEQEWRLEEALAVELGAKQTMLRVEGDGKGGEDADGWIGREVREVRIGDGEEGEGKVRRRRRSVGYGGATGSLDYERVEGVEFTGW